MGEVGVNSTALACYVYNFTVMESYVTKKTFCIGGTFCIHLTTQHNTSIKTLDEHYETL
jgi:hypothetical protein